MTLDEITYKVNGCAMTVHNTLGNGFQEVFINAAWLSKWEMQVYYSAGKLTRLFTITILKLENEELILLLKIK